MAPKLRPDPYPGFNFRVNLTLTDGSTVVGTFTEVSGLESEIKPIEYRTGAEGITVRKIAGLVTHTDLVLKWGTTGEVAFWNWVTKGVEGATQRAEGSIVLFDETNKVEVMRWNFVRAWPSKYTGPTFNAANNEIAMESVTVCHEGLTVDT